MVLPSTAATRLSWMRVLVLVLLASVIAWTMMGEEDVVRAIKDKVGMRNVEGYAADIRFAASESQVDPLLIAAVMYAESSGIKGSISSADARGLMQLSLGSAQDAARKLGLPEPTREDLIEDASLNIRLGANHLAWLIENDGPDLERVLAAYNAGRTKVRRWVRKAGSWQAWRDERVDSGTSQVMAYVFKILAAMEEFEVRGNIVKTTSKSP